VATAANVHLAAAIPNFAILEYSHLVSEHSEVQTTGPELKDGYFELPTAPGLGIELDMDVIEKNPYVSRQYKGVFYPDGTPADGHGTSDPRYN
jgi:galactonate dehydratase